MNYELTIRQHRLILRRNTIYDIRIVISSERSEQRNLLKQIFVPGFWLRIASPLCHSNRPEEWSRNDGKWEYPDKISQPTKLRQ
ncbi:hypothetical protein ACFL1G_04615 [Planctomycetota bacterium]